MNMGKLSLGVAVGLAAGLLVTSPAMAEQLDQQATAPTAGDSAWLGSTQTVAQPFTAAASGDLTRVTLEMAHYDTASKGTNTNVTVGIYATTPSGRPTGTPLASQAVSGSALQALAADRVLSTLSVTFTNPTTISSGQTYALVVSSTDGYPSYHWFQSGYALGTYYGNGSGDLTTVAAGWGTWNPVAFATYLNGSTGGSDSSSGSGSSGGVESDGPSPTDAPVAVQLALGSDGIELVNAEVPTGWVQLPPAVSIERSTRTFLGWSTSEAFPVERARAQVAAGWGAIDEVIGDERMIFIPAGGFAHVTGPTRLHAIWG